MIYIQLYIQWRADFWSIFLLIFLKFRKFVILPTLIDTLVKGLDPSWKIKEMKSKKISIFLFSARHRVSFTETKSRQKYCSPIHWLIFLSAFWEHHRAWFTNTSWIAGNYIKWNIEWSILATWIFIWWYNTGTTGIRLEHTSIFRNRLIKKCSASSIKSIFR